MAFSLHTRPGAYSYPPLADSRELDRHSIAGSPVLGWAEHDPASATAEGRARHWTREESKAWATT